MKIFHWRHKNGEAPYRDKVGRFTSFKRNVFWFCKRVFWGMSISLIAMGLYVAGQTNSSITSITQVVNAESKIPPVLQRIAKCESSDTHYGKSGQVLLSANTNDTVDVGRYQVNSVWF